MDLKPVEVNIHLLTIRGYLMQRALTAGLCRLACTEEECFLVVTEGRNPDEGKDLTNFEIRLRCLRTLEVHAPWIVEEDENYPKHRTYRATFETESASEIVEAVRRLLGTPVLLSIQ